MAGQPVVVVRTSRGVFPAVQGVATVLAGGYVIMTRIAIPGGCTTLSQESRLCAHVGQSGRGLDATGGQGNSSVDGLHPGGWGTPETNVGFTLCVIRGVVPAAGGELQAWSGGSGLGSGSTGVMTRGVLDEGSLHVEEGHVGVQGPAPMGRAAMQILQGQKQSGVVGDESAVVVGKTQKPR